MGENTQPRRDQCVAAADPQAIRLLDAARQELSRGRRECSAASRYTAAHLAVYRAATAVLTARRERARAAACRLPPWSLWELLSAAEPALAEWAAFFAASGRERAVVEAGPPRAVTHRQADDLLLDAETFVALAGDALGMSAPAAAAAPVATWSRPRAVTWLHRRLRGHRWRRRSALYS